MIAVDFIYDGQHLSSKGYSIVTFDSSGGLETTPIGSAITFTTVSRHNGQYYSKNNAIYKDCLSATFQICKNPDEYLSQDEMEITSEEFRALMHWLNQRDFKPMCFLDEDGAATCYYDASFNISKLKIAGKTYGLELTMETNRPFGYGKEYVKSCNSASMIVDAVSDDVGYFYPTVIIECNAAGDVTLTNEDADCVMQIQNCTAGEVITIDGDTMTISSSAASHDIANDFNYTFLKLINTVDSDKNTIGISPVGTNVTIKYKPIIKEIP